MRYKIGGSAMKTNKGIYSLMVVAAALMVIAMAMPVMADRYGTFEGTITKSGQLMTNSGSEYWLIGHKANQVEKQVGQKVEIKGLLRENMSTSSVYSGPTLEVYSYDLMNGTKSQSNMGYPY
jgi:hypothetical protein